MRKKVTKVKASANKVILEPEKVFPGPKMVATASATTSTRRNATSSLERTDRFANIEDGLVPFTYSNINGTCYVTVHDAVELCQKAYYNFAVFKNTIDLMTEFSASNIYFKGGSAKSKEFFEALFKKINLWSFQDKFFREYYRSGNVFIYRFDSKVTSEDITRITQTFGLSKAAALTLPARYIVLNPADVHIGGSVSFSTSSYYKNLTDFEIAQLRNPKTDEDKEVFESLPKEVKEAIKKKGAGAAVLLPLDPNNVYGVFYKKQDYEPFAVPMGYPVLDDINYKEELKKMDKAIARTMQQAILLITMGTEPDKGGINHKNLEAMQALFENQSVGRVLVADYTTKAEFVVPGIGDLLDPKKYEMVDRDIKIGLNNILIGGGDSEKFANKQILAKVFIERLKQAREAFICEFLTPEIKRMSKALGFKNFPTPYFEEVDLKDEIELSRIFTRLVELGVLTPEEGFIALESGRIPTPEESVESQKKLRQMKDEGLYQPLVGGPFDQLKIAKLTGEQKMEQQQQKENGRPPGSSAPKTPSSVSPMGGSNLPVEGSEEKYDFKKIKSLMISAQNLDKKVQFAIRKKHKIRKLSETQLGIVSEIVDIIIANEEPDNWLDSVDFYIEEPADKNTERVNKINEIALNHQVNNYLAGILYAAKV